VSHPTHGERREQHDGGYHARHEEAAGSRGDPPLAPNGKTTGTEARYSVPSSRWRPMGRGTSSRTLRLQRELVADVRRLVSTSSLGERRPNVQLVARALGMSTRTLQRRLSELGFTYARVITRARTDMARRLLEEPGAKISDVARMLGYSDAGHFTRAFLRWTGLRPREFRRLRRSATEGPQRKHGPLHDAAPRPRRGRARPSSVSG
jgi:AraC-like DNA-binding protein